MEKSLKFETGKMATIMHTRFLDPYFGKNILHIY